jgi:hypothetical protein
MLLFRIVMLLAAGLAFISSCSRGVEQEVVDYQNDKNVRLPGWECHQVYSVRRDSARAESFLEVVAYPKKEYPGFSLGWLSGDWTQFSTLQIIARTHGKSPSPFFLTVWDGKGIYDYNNRFQKEYVLDSGWTVCGLPVQGGMVKPNGRETDIRRISKVVFFTSARDTPTIFDVKKVSLE